MVLSMISTAPTAVFFMSSLAAAPTRCRYKNGETTTGYEQQDPNYQ